MQARIFGRYSFLYLSGLTIWSGRLIGENRIFDCFDRSAKIIKGGYYEQKW